MLTTVRSSLHRVLSSSLGNALPGVPLARSMASRLNTFLGKPLAPEEELRARAAARARLQTLRTSSASPQPRRREPAPVMVYFEGNRNGRELERTKELLESHGIAYKLLDISGDDACQAFVTQQAKCDLDKLPVTFVAGQAVGPYPDLVAFDVAGHLRRSVFG